MIEEVVPVSTTKFPIVPVAEVLSKQRELEINGLAISLVSNEPASPESPNSAKRGESVFEIRGLKPGYRAWIVQEADTCHLMRETLDAESEWLGEYPSVEAALRALSNRAWD